MTYTQILTVNKGEGSTVAVTNLLGLITDNC